MEPQKYHNYYDKTYHPQLADMVEVREELLSLQKDLKKRKNSSQKETLSKMIDQLLEKYEEMIDQAKKVGDQGNESLHRLKDTFLEEWQKLRKSFS